MIRKKLAPDLIRGGTRFSEKIMLKQKAGAGCRSNHNSSRSRAKLSRLRDPSGPMRQHRVELLARFLEHGERCSFKHAPARQFDRHRVHEAIVDQDLEMDVGAGRQAGRADEADDLALADAAADIEPAGEGGHVAVSGLVAVRMADADIFAVAAFDADLVDGA